LFFFFSSRRRHTRSKRDWSSDVCSSDLATQKENTMNTTTTRTVSEVIAYNDTLETVRTLLAADKVEEASALLDQIENPEGRRMEYAIEMHDGTTDRERRAYGVVHRAGCADLRGPAPVGTGGPGGASSPGPDGAMDVEDDLIRLAPCAR